MQAPPITAAEEARRLDTLRCLGVLDTAPEPVFDAITALAARACGVPIALISLIDSDRQWFKSNRGLPGTGETSRSVAFCDHAIRDVHLLEVADAAADPRFALNPLVIGEPHIRFYAGMPIVMPGGERIGTVCVIDLAPRQLDALQQGLLEELGRLAATYLQERSQSLALRRELTSQEDRYRAIVEDQAELVSLADRDGTLTLVNPAYARHFGVEAEHMIGRNLLDFVEPADRAAVSAHLDRVCATQSPASGINRHRGADGNSRWVAWSNRPVFDAQGRVCSIQSVGRDITEQRLAETALAGSESRYRRLYEATPALLFSIDPKGNMLGVSDLWLQRLGYRRSEVIGRPSFEFLTPESRRRAIEQVLPRFFANGRVDNIEYQFVCKDGSLVDVLLSSTLERAGDGSPVRSLAVLQDVTEKKAIAAELGRTHTHLNTILNNVPVMLGYWDCNRIIRFANREFEDALARSGARLIGQSFEQLFEAVDPQFTVQALNALRDVMEGRRQEFECAMQLLSGLRQLDVTFVPDQSADGKVIGFYGMWIDVTGRKSMEIRLRRELEARLNSERRLRVVTDNLPALVSYLDHEQRFQFANKAYEDWFGTPAQHMVGKTLLEFYGPEVHHAIEPRFRAALAGESVSYERPMSGAGLRDYVQVTMVPHRNEQGSVVGVYTLIHDISARRAAEQRSAASERFIRNVTDNLPALVAYVDRNQTYRFANAHFRQVMGIDPAAVIGRTMKDFLGADTHRELRPHIEAALEGQRQKFERTGWQHNAHIHFLVEYVPEVNPAGGVDGFFILVFDISERRRTELALVQSEQRLRTITDNLPAMVSHLDSDLRYTFANAKLGRALGCDPTDVVGRLFRELRGEAVYRKVSPTMARALAGEAVSVEFSSVTADGVQRDFEGSYVPEFDASGHALGFYALTVDVTERKQAAARLHASEQLLDRTGSIAGVGGWQLDIATGVVDWTAQTRRIHEVDDDYVPNVQQGIDFYAGEGRPAIEAAVRQALDCGTPWDLVLPFVTATGRAIWVRATGEVELADGKPARMLGAFQDVSQRVEFERQLHEQAELLQVTLKSIGDGVITTDEHGRVRWMNPAAERMTGWTSAEAAGKVSAQVFHVVHADTRAPAPDPVELCLRTLGISGLPARSVLISINGEELAVEDAASPIHDEQGRLRGAVLVFHDVSEQRRLSDQMTHRATHDELTGLVNRAEFETRVARVLDNSRDDASVSSMMFIDLDQFKLVNDACGHAMGDKLLCQVSALMSQCVRNRDTLARLGGDEFGVLLEHCNVEQAQRVAQGICDRMDEFRFIHEGRKFRIGTSIGLVPIDARWSSQASLQQAADTACYAAKEAGRNRVHVWFDTDHVLRSREGETQWGSRLEHALDENDFVLFAQRIEAVQAEPAGLHVEVLLRLRERDGTIVAPGLFLPAAERFHMASRIDRWVLRELFKWMRNNAGFTDIETIAVNLSGQSIGDRAFHRFVVQLLDELPIDPRKLCFEVTETAAITNLADATSFMQAMRKLGMRVALDDFGAGASSFGYLKNLPVDYLKIDGQFIRNMQNDPLDMAAVRCFHDVAKAIGVKTVAEFVETEAVMQTLRDIGIDFAQGYLLHRPEPLENLLASVRSASE